MPNEHSNAEDKPRRIVIIVVAVIAAVLIGGFFYLLLRRTMDTPQTTQLQDAIRPGGPQWDDYSKRIVLDDPPDCPEEGARFCATESKRALGDTVMTLTATVRNFTGKTIVGLEIRGFVVDHDGKPVKDKTIVIIPTRQAELDPNKTMKASVLIDGLTDNDDRADVRMEVTAFKLR
jgi:hypothetical protein